MKKVILVFLIAFLLFSFACWDINPRNWHEVTRGMYIFVSVVISAFLLEEPKKSSAD